MVLDYFIAALWIMIPAYATNMSPLLAKGKYPVDFGKKIGKNRILGDGKTWEGTLLAIFIGIITGYIISFFNPQFTIYVIILIPVGVMIGDMVASLIKRRFAMKRGKSFPVLDQLDFIIGAIIFTYAFIEYTWITITILLLLTLFFHRFASIVGYKIGAKREPW